MELSHVVSMDTEEIQSYKLARKCRPHSRIFKLKPNNYRYIKKVSCLSIFQKQIGATSYLAALLSGALREPVTKRIFIMDY